MRAPQRGAGFAHDVQDHQPLAVIGLSFRFPQGATNSDQFWRMMETKRCAMTEMPKERLTIDAFHHGQRERRDTMTVRGGHFLEEDLGCFDAPFFSISPSEAAAMDPQQRKLLEVSYQALENGKNFVQELYEIPGLTWKTAGIPLETISGSKTAVFTGSFSDDYRIACLKDPENMSPYTASGTEFSILANRLSWWFNLKGPSMNIDNACASSLTALHLACQSLASGESSMALVGGANILFAAEQFIALDNQYLLSSSSRSFSFDHRASGYGRGEGFGVLVIKSVTDALQNGDTIRAIIRGTGASQDGRTPSITSPSQSAQESLIRETYARYHLDPKDTAFVEAHGTGTAQGDPTEAKALGHVFGSERPADQPLIIGAVKSNIGHLEGCSGIAGVIKTILALERGRIPPNANFEKLNAEIDAKGLNIMLAEESMPWPTSGIRRASVNSFGFGGSNAHAILEDASSFLETRSLIANHHYVGVNQWCTQASSTKQNYPKLLVFSAYDESGISRSTEALMKHFATSPSTFDTATNIEDLTYTLAMRRTHFMFRSYALISTLSDLHSLPSLLSKPTRQRRRSGLGFVFTGQGAQSSQMGMELIAYPIFKASLMRADSCLQGLGCRWNIFDELAKPNEVSNIQHPEYSQTLCTALQIALVDLLRHFHVKPRKVVGHSSGEIAAAYAIGALSFTSALKAAYFRGKLAASLASDLGYQGAMLAVVMSEAQTTIYLEKFLKDNPSYQIGISCVNSPKSITLGGNADAIAAISAQLEADGITAQKLRVDVAYHSPHVTVLSEEYHRLMGSLTAGDIEPNAVMISSVTGSPVEPYELQQPQYWVRNMESPVRFSDAITHAISTSTFHDQSNDSREIFDVLEIGPHSALQGPIKDIITSLKDCQEVRYHSVLSRKKNTMSSLLNTVGQLHCLGYSTNLMAANLIENKPLHVLVDLPSYPFDHSRRYWRESRISQDYRLRKVPRLDLLGAPLLTDGPLELGRTWRKMTKLAEAPWIRDHLINDTIIYPAAGMLCMALEAIHQLVDRGKLITNYVIKEASVTQPLLVSLEKDNVESYFHMKILPSETNNQLLTAEFKLFTIENGNWGQNCSGIVQAHLAIDQRHSPNANDYVPMPTRMLECNRNLDIDLMYEDFRLAGYEFGPAFRHMNKISFGTDQDAYAEISVFQWDESQPHVIHPVTLDAVFQAMLAARIESASEHIPTAVPTKVRDLSIAGTGISFPAMRSLPVYVKVNETLERTTDSSGYGTNESGDIVISVSSLETTFVDSRVQESTDNPEQPLCYNIIKKPDLDLLDQTKALQLCQFPTTSQDRVQYQKDLALLLCNFNMQNTKLINEYLDGSMQPHMQRYLQWMKEQVVKLMPDQNPYSTATGKEPYVLGSLIDVLSEKVSENSEEGKAFAKVGKNVPGILRGDLDASELLTLSGLAQNFDQEAILRSNPMLETFIDLMVFKKPGLKVIEISGGRGLVAEKVLSYATIRDANGFMLPAISEYHLTDSSTESLNMARERLKNNSEALMYSILDITKDPIQQGFNENAYDLVIAANALHKTENLDVSLRNARKLLKPNGRLIIIEPTHNQWVLQAIFGVLPSFWRNNDGYRDSSPYVSTEIWDRILRENRFSGIDIGLHDDPNNTTYSAMLSTAIDGNPTSTSWPDIVILVNDDEDKSKAGQITPSLTRSIHDLGHDSVTTIRMDDLPQVDLTNRFCICLAEVEQPYVATMTENEYLSFRNLMSTVGGMLWVRSRGDSVPELHMIDGTMRVCRSESITSKFVTLAIDAQSHTDSMIQNIMRVLHRTLEDSISEIEVELEEHDGLLTIPRAIPATYINRHIKQAEAKTTIESFSSNATYVFAGGFGGLACSIVRWMASNGAKNFILLSRSGPRSSAAKELLEELAAQGARVEYPICDISVETQVRRALLHCSEGMPPIKGCIQGCLVLEDHVFETMTYDQWTKAVRPRVQGTRHLHSFLPKDLDFFFLLSSVNGVLGNRFQANYAASNAFLDAFAHTYTRNDLNYPVVSLDLGWMLSAGAVAESEFLQKRLKSLGFLIPISQSQLLGLLDYYCAPHTRVDLVTCQTLLGVGFPTNISKQRSGYPPLLTRPLWRVLKMMARGADDESPAKEVQKKMPLIDLLASKSSPLDKVGVVCSALLKWLSEILSVDENLIDSDKPVHEAGVDSLMAVELRTWFKKEFAANVSVFNIMGNANLKDLCKKVVDTSS